MSGGSRFLSIAAGALLAAFLVSNAAAQRGSGEEGSAGQGNPYNRLYDPARIETVRGVVLSVGQAAPRQGVAPSLRISLKTGSGTIPVHLGPAWFWKGQPFRIVAKDSIEVKGSRVSFDGKPALVAAEVRKGGKSVLLRNEAGVPLWSRGMRK